MKPKPLYREIALKINAISNCKESGNQEWEIKHSEDLKVLESFLPSGCGFNRGCLILESSHDERIIIYAPYHSMDENGFYSGWYEIEIEISPSLLWDYKMDVRIDAPDNPELWGMDEYIYDVFDYHLKELVIKKGEREYETG